MYHTIQAKKKGSRIVEPIEIDQNVVKWLRLIVVSRDNRVDLTPHKQEILDYMSAYNAPGSSQIVRIMKKYDNVALVRHN